MPLGDIGAGLGGAIGSIAILAGAGGKGGDKYYKKALEVWEKLQDPEFDFRELAAPELRIFAQYFPETYDAVVPEEVKTIVESPELRLSELRGLKRYERMAEEGLPVSRRISETEAARTLAGEAARGRETALADVARRGRLGTTDELVAGQLAASSAAETARGLGEDLSRRNEEAQLTGLQGAMEGASRIRGEDFRAAERNADIMNRLSEYIANSRTEAARYGASARERAGFGNVEQRQRIGEENVRSRYGTALENLERKNRLKGLLADYRMRKAQGLSGAYGAYGLKKDQDKAAREATIMSLGQGLGQTAGSAAAFL